MGRGNESLFALPGSHHQDGRQAHIRIVGQGQSLYLCCMGNSESNGLFRTFCVFYLKLGSCRQLIE